MLADACCSPLRDRLYIRATASPEALEEDCQMSRLEEVLNVLSSLGECHLCAEHFYELALYKGVLCTFHIRGDCDRVLPDSLWGGSGSDMIIWAVLSLAPYAVQSERSTACNGEEGSYLDSRQTLSPQVILLASR